MESALAANSSSTVVSGRCSTGEAASSRARASSRVGHSKVRRLRSAATAIIAAAAATLATTDGIVIAEGLDGTERVITTAGAFLHEGEEVRVDTPKATP